MSMFQRAVKQQKNVSIAISGPSNSGKTYSALRIAKGFGDKVAVYDTEGNASALYADDFSFDSMAANTRDPDEVIRAINGAADAGYAVIIIDSLTHSWEETKNIVDEKAKAMRTSNTFAAWKEGNLVWERLIKVLQAPPIHVICTMRAKTEFVQETDSNGKKSVRKIGLAPQVRDGSEYEFDIMLSLNHEHYASVEKTRMKSLDGKSYHLPSEALGAEIKAWAAAGVEKVSTEKWDAMDARSKAILVNHPEARTALIEARKISYQDYELAVIEWEAAQ
jgi:hypothetical protein